MAMNSKKYDEYTITSKLKVYSAWTMRHGSSAPPSSRCTQRLLDGFPLGPDFLKPVNSLKFVYSILNAIISLVLLILVNDVEDKICW